MRNDLIARPSSPHWPAVEQDRAVAEPRDRCMLWETKSTVRPELPNVLHATEAPPLELGVADGEHLVDEQDLGLEVRGDRERESHVHPARVALHRRVEERRSTPANSTISSKLACDLAAPHPEDRAVQVDVLAAGQLGVEAGADLEQAADAAADLRPARRRRR